MASAYTITDGTGTTDLGNIQNRSIGGAGTIVNVSLPDQNPNDTVLVPLIGASNVFQLQGTFTGTESELKTFELKLLEWKTNGSKLSEANITYHDGILDTDYSVRVTNQSSSRSVDSANLLTYSLELTEGNF